MANRETRGRIHPRTRRALCALISLSLLGAVLISVDRAELLRTLKSAHVGWFVLAIALFIPQKLLQAFRWRRMTTSFCPIGLGEALRLILAGDALNLVLPSKMGDLAKALFLRSQGRLPLSHGLNLVVFEKMLDMSAVCLLLVAGLVAIRRFDAIGVTSLLAAGAVIAATVAVCFWPFLAAERLRGKLQLWTRTPGVKARLAGFLLGTGEVVGDLVKRGAALRWITALSLAIWILHLLQIYLFFLTLHTKVSFLTAITLMPIAIFVGLLPISIGGIGTRDAAMLFLFGPFEAAARIAGVALLTHLRYLVPGLAGLPFFHAYLAQIRSWQAAGEHPIGPRPDGNVWGGRRP